MNQYRQLTLEERYVIQTSRKENIKPVRIARMLNRAASTITRELRRNKLLTGCYNATQAHQSSRTRLQASHRHVRISPANWRAVEACLSEQHSPEQISGRAKLLGFKISPERIYQYVAQDVKDGGSLFMHLRQRKKVRYARCLKRDDRRGQICNRIGIEHRPAIVDKRIRVGDWEVDTIVSRESKAVLITAVDRTTLATIIQRASSKEAQAVAKELIKRLAPVKEYVHTITADNGKEFALHEKIANRLSADFFFARPYHSWERGSNENANGLIRQYFPKKTDFAKSTKAQIALVESMLNNRPRKSLGYKTAAEYFLEKTGLFLPMGRNKGIKPEQLYNVHTFALAA